LVYLPFFFQENNLITNKVANRCEQGVVYCGLLRASRGMNIPLGGLFKAGLGGVVSLYGYSGPYGSKSGTASYDTGG